MSGQRDENGWPRRLREGHGDVAQAMKTYVRRLEVGGHEPAAFAVVRAALRHPTARWPLVALAAAGAVAVALTVLVWWPQPTELALEAPSVTTPVPVAPPSPSKGDAAGAGPARPGTIARDLQTPSAGPVRRPVRGSVRRSASAPLLLGASDVRLPRGRTEIAGEATVWLAAGTKADARAEGEFSVIVLEQGRVELQVAPRAPGRLFVVRADPFSFVVVGTAFNVTRQRGRVTLRVQDGRVAVLRESETLATIAAGGSWTGDATGVLPPATASTDDVAAYEAARSLKDSSGDLDKACVAFQQYLARFPRGALRVEAALSLVEILPRLGRHREALAVAARLIADPAATPRHAELYLVRGNILRSALGDRETALAEYAAAAAGTGPAADDAAYLRAVCLEELGRSGDAQDAFALYLQRPAARHAAEAVRRKEALSR